MQVLKIDIGGDGKQTIPNLTLVCTYQQEQHDYYAATYAQCPCRLTSLTSYHTDLCKRAPLAL